MSYLKCTMYLGLALTASALPGAAAAAAPLGSELKRCAAITAADERLACYDALAKSAAPAVDTAALAARAPASAEFGTVQVRPKELPKPEGPDHIQAVVKNLEVDRRGNVSVHLDNGQVWTFNDPDAQLRLGDTIVLRRAALGSFLMTTANHHTYRVQRVQ